MRVSRSSLLPDKHSPAAIVITFFVAAALVAPLVAYAQDPYPSQAIAFFNAKQCPGGWTPTGNLADTMSGRFLVPLMPNGNIQDTVGKALASGEARTHTHSFNSSFTLPDIKIKGTTTCITFCNDDLTPAGTYKFNGTTAASSSEVPYVQLLVCVKEENAAPDTGIIPSGVLIVTAGLDCPSEWSQPTPTQGRFMVGVPAGGTALATFGGDPLKPQKDRTHAHAFSGSITTKQKELNKDLFWGYNSGYGESGTYSYHGPTNPASTGLPYMQILQCQKD